MPARSDVLQWGHERARVARWKGDGDVALLTPASDGPLPSYPFIRRCVDQLAREGYRSVVTAALTVPEQAPFRDAGFQEHERLRLLSHDLRHLSDAPPAPLRRAVDSDRPAVLAVDALSFSPFWQLDAGSLQDAVDATPSTRFRVVGGDLGVGAGDGIAYGVGGYAITGRTQRRGYVQRLAVQPALRGRGLGSALVLDGLHWMRRRGVERAVVNTQLDNRAAHALYLRLGFREEPLGLAVLRQDLR